MRKVIFTCLFCFLVWCPVSDLAMAQEPQSSYTPYFPNYPPMSPQEMMDFARKGAVYLENGGDVQEFNKNPGKFTKGDFMDYRYLAVGDCKTKTVLAHPFLPNVRNKENIMITIRDAHGRAYSAEACEAAMENPSGAWVVSYVYKAPGEDRIDLLYQYYIRVKGTNLAVAVFSRNLKIEDLLIQRAKEEEKVLNEMIEERTRKTESIQN